MDSSATLKHAKTERGFRGLITFTCIYVANVFDRCSSRLSNGAIDVGPTQRKSYSHKWPGRV